MRLNAIVVRLALVATAVGVSASGCTLAYNTSATQCRSEQDCRSRGPAFADTTCNQDRICVPVTAQVAGLCSTNQECTDKNGGAPFRCLPSTHQCVPLTTSDCPRLLGQKTDYLDDNAIYLGVQRIAAIGGLIIEDSTDYARNEIRTTLGGGLPAVQPEGPKRPLAFVVCPNEPSATGLGSLPSSLQGAFHLVNDVQVPGVVGPYILTTVLATEPQYYIPGHVATFLPTETAPDYGVRLTFSMNGKQANAALVLQSLMDSFLVNKVYMDGIAQPNEPLRVQFIYSTETTDAAIGNYVIQNLKFNTANGPGTPGTLSTVDNGANFIGSSLGDITDRVGDPNVPSQSNAAVAAAIANKPHIILMGFPGTIAVNILTPIEAQWPTGTPRPLYVSTLPSFQNVVINVIGKNESLRQRYFGLEIAPPTLDQQRFLAVQTGLRTSFPDLATQNLYVEAYNSYDSVYTMVYAILAAGATQLSGDVIAQGVQRLSSGPMVNTGPADLPRAVSILQGGGSITLNTLTGPLGFDSAGIRKSNSGVFCVAGKGGVATSIHHTNYVWDTTLNKATGMIDCPVPSQ